MHFIKPLATHQALMNTPLCQFIHNYRLPFGEIYENYPLSIFTKCSHLSSFNFVVIFYNYTKGRFPNWLDRLATDKTDNRNEDMFVWCYESISLHAGDLWQILHVINLWVKISMLDSDGQIVLFVCGWIYKGLISSYLSCLFSLHYGWLFPSTLNY